MDEVIWMEVPTRHAFINITPQVRECVRESGVTEGLVLINSMHTTAAVFVDGDEQGLYHHYEPLVDCSYTALSELSQLISVAQRDCLVG
ncbi:MAG TPA: YjbQ family protein [Pyrinomonadaceae bacterium]|jgi:thiamine phosphate synthase YjbQ (UPF0047 family)|nr:YjbQ family protein [Pyrinomonadaceae bacterium]